MPRLQNLVVEKLQEIVIAELPIHGSPLRYIYERTNDEDFDNKLRSLAVRQLFYNHTRNNVEAYRGSVLPYQLMEDFVAFKGDMLPRLGIRSPNLFDQCMVSEALGYL